MIGWHCSDAWFAGSRDSIQWDAIRVVGGVAAPLFLFAAGATVGLHLRAGRPRIRLFRRAGELIVLGWGLQTFVFLVDAGYALQPQAWPTGLAATLGCLLAWRAVRGTDSGPVWLRGRRATLVASVLLAIAVWRLHIDAPERVATMLRVDVLACIGMSIAVCAVIARAQPAVLLVVVLLTVAVTEPLRIALNDHALVPPSVSAWIANTSDGSRGSIAAFPLLPFAAYAVLGSLWIQLRRRRALAYAIAGTLIAVLSFPGGFDLVRRVAHNDHQARLVLHVVFTVGLFGVAIALGMFARRVRAIHDVGRMSLWLYVANVAIAYGVITLPLHRQLGVLTLVIAIAINIAVSIAIATRRHGRFSRRRISRPRATTEPLSDVGSAPNSRA